MKKEKKLFTDRRWTDPPVATVIGHRKITQKEELEADKFIERQIKKIEQAKEDKNK